MSAWPPVVLTPGIVVRASFLRVHRSIAGWLLVILTCVSLICVESARSAEPSLPPDEPYMKAGLTRLQPKMQNGKFLLPLILLGEQRCFFADRDAILLELAHSKPGTKLFLSIEPVLTDDRGFTPLRFDITSSGRRLDSGYPLPISLKPQKKPMLLGVYICKEYGPAGRCAEKQVRPLEEVFSTYDALKGKVPKNYLASDKVYFFKHIILSENGIYLPTAGMNEHRYKSLEEWVGSFGRNETTGKTLQRVKAISSALKSRAFEVRNNSALLKIPSFHAGKCGQPGTQYFNMGE